MEEDKDFIYIALDLHDFTLDAWIKEEDVKNMSEEDWSRKAAGLVEDFLKGLEYLHSKNMLHRDLKVSVNCFFLNAINNTTVETYSGCCLKLV